MSHMCPHMSHMCPNMSHMCPHMSLTQLQEIADDEVETRENIQKWKKFKNDDKVHMCMYV